MATIYSVSLWDATIATASVATQSMGTTGNTVVIREIHMTNSSSSSSYLKGFRLYSATGVLYWQLYGPGLRGGWTYQFSGRLVVAGGAVLSMQTLDTNWSLKMSGYNLTP